MDTAHTPLDPDLLVRHRRFMRAVARSLLADEHRVEDVVQQASLLALERPPRSAGALRGWLARVVRNLALATAGREAQRPERERHAARSESVPPEAEREFELQHRVAAALRSLPEPYRTAIHLRYYRELGPREIALELGVPLDTVKTRLRRGLELLRNDLDTTYGARGLWCLPLASLLDVPWKPGVAPASAGAVATAALLEGVVSMKVFAGLAFLTAAVVAIVLVSGPGSPPSEPAAVEAAEVPAGALAEPALEAEVAAASTPAEEEREAVPAPAVAPAPAPEVRALGRLRVTDAGGVALAGARVALADTEVPPSFSDADGQVELDLAALPPGAATRELVLSHDDFLTLRPSVTLPPGPGVDLGTFALVRGGRILGTVVDRNGVGVSGALVFAADPAQRFWGDVASLVSNGNQRYVAQADERGEFLIRGVPAGLVRVWAGAEGLVDGVSGALNVVAGEDLRAVEVRLDAAPQDHEIAGRVVLPEGQESSSLEVWYSFVSSEGRRTRTAPVGADGRFRIQLESPVPHDLWAEDAPSRWDAKRHVFTGERSITGHRGRVERDVPPGTSNLVLGFEQTLRVPVVVTNQRGEDLERFTLGTVEFSGNDLSHQRPWFREVTSPALLDVPATDFYVSVSAEGHDRVQLGPYDDASVPRELVVELTSLPAVEGVVRAAGRPVEGATVEVFRPAGTSHKIVHDGFQLRMHQVPVGSGATDEEGRFALTVRESGSFFVRATLPGWAGAELERVAIDHTVGRDGLELELSEGGAIEGRLLLPPGESPAGAMVGVSRGDPYPRTVALQSDGRFRFEGLLPGEWLVERVTDHTQTTTTSSSRSPVVWSGNCTVEVGETTRLELDLSRDDRVVLSGRLEVPARPHLRWEVKLSEGDDGGFDGDRVDSTTSAEDGRFELIAPAAGEYLLTMTGGDIERDGMLLARRLDLEGDAHEWNETIRLGTVEGTVGLSPLPPMIVWMVEEGTSVTATRVHVEGDGFFSAEVPAGPGKMRYATPEMMERLPLEWPVVGSATVPAGGEARFEPAD